MEFRPLRARNRPGLLLAKNEALAGMAHVQLNAGLPLPAVLLSFQEIAEKALLQIHAIVRVIMGPVLDAVPLEPLLLRRGPEEALEIAARMQRLPTPVRR